MRTANLFVKIASLLIAALILQPGSGFAAEWLGPEDINALPATTPTAVLKYGTGSLQFGELRLPEGQGPFPVAIVIHGGCWTRGFATARIMAPVASALTQRGVATWNIEYRQVGDSGGGWPGTFQDWAAAADYVRVVAESYPLDLSRIVATGHSAGAHAALWLAARQKLPATSEIRGADPIAIQAAVAIDGPGDLIGFVATAVQVCGSSVIEALMGGTPAQCPERYAQASPQSLLPLHVRQFLITAAVLTMEKAQEYQIIARENGETVEILAPPDTGHFEVIAPGYSAWQAVEDLIVERAFPGPGPVIRNPGLQTNTFGFFVSWATNGSVVVETSASLSESQWRPLSTNILVNGECYFSDPQWKDHPTRFYRVRLHHQ